MTESSSRPPWPKYTDETGKSRLADWMQDQLAPANDELYGDEPKIEGLLSSEKAILIEAFETKKWQKVAARLREADASRSFTEVVADLIELNAMANGAKLLSAESEKFIDSYTHLRRREDILAVQDLETIKFVLRRTYPELVLVGKGKRIDKMASWLSSILRGAEARMSDKALRKVREKYVKSLEESFTKASDGESKKRLALLVHRVLGAYTTS